MATSEDKSYTHIQSVASMNWTVTHRLGKHPSVTIVDTNGIEIFGRVEILDDTLLKIEFSTPMTGKVFCN